MGLDVLYLLIPASVLLALVALGLFIWAIHSGQFDDLETVLRLIPMYYVRAIGGGLYLIGMCLLAYNAWATIRQGAPLPDQEASAPSLKGVAAPTGLGLQRWLEARPMHFALWTLVAVAIGGVVQLVPLLFVQSNVPRIASVHPYTPLELEGRDIYIREGCYLCHSQMIRPFRAETERYGEYSKAGEFVYDHPFQFGSKRTGPDLQRVGGKYPDIWHYRHMEDPRSTSPGSIMPDFAWIVRDKLDTSHTQAKMRAMRAVGVPYTQEDIDNAPQALNAQAARIAQALSEGGAKNTQDNEIVALIAYLQRLGTDIKAKPVASAEVKP